MDYVSAKQTAQTITKRYRNRNETKHITKRIEG